MGHIIMEMVLKKNITIRLHNVPNREQPHLKTVQNHKNVSAMVMPERVLSCPS
jgi:hypothetical protein